MDGCHQCYQWTLKAVGQTVGHEKEHNLLLGLWLTSTIKSCKSPVNPTCKNWLLPYIRQLYSMPLYSVYCSITLTIIVLQFFFSWGGGNKFVSKGTRGHAEFTSSEKLQTCTPQSYFSFLRLCVFFFSGSHSLPFCVCSGQQLFFYHLIFVCVWVQ